jgi:hypothetical protein
MRHTIMVGLACLFAFSTTAIADATCEASIDANPNIVIPVHVERHTEISSHPDNFGASFDSYEVKFGANNEFDTICVSHPNAVLLFTLPKANGIEFTDIRFYENGLPSTQIIQSEVHKDYIRVLNKNDSLAKIKYVLVLFDRRNGTIITRDPDILNDQG